ncbi:thermonuclease family protein [Rothia sp. P5766]|uniref:thermonuclease family protein n=1 Tax=unclassified Rothia (in: high G+C Gram-positive bacteria) TaxID=2689056 RepID=UPI003AE1C208
MKRLIPLVASALLVLTGCGQNDQANSTATSSPTISYTDGMTVTVVSVESANTFTAEIEGLKKQVRLVNLAAPSPNGLALSSDCLVDESKALLAEKLPANSQVTLKFDENQRGKTGYVEAAVYSGDAFINRDMARAGMVATTFSTASDKFYPEISQAQQDAANEGLGLYSRDLKCAIPALIQEQKKAVDDAKTWEVNTGQDASAEDQQKEAERQKIYKDASAFYRELKDQVKSPAQWVGSIVTLDSVSKQLTDLEQTLGDDFYPQNGTSVNQQKKSGVQSTPARPGS